MSSDLRRARQLLGNGQWTQAITLLEAHLRRNPPTIDALQLLAHAHGRIGQHERARALIASAIRLAPNDAALQLTAANLAQDCQDMDGAIGALRLAIKLRPDFPEALNNLGILLIDSGDLQGARQAFEQAVAWRPGYPRALANLASVYVRLKLVPEAVASAQRAVSADAANVHAWHVLGQAQMTQGRIADAEFAFKKALALDPRHAVTALLYGRLLLGQRRLDDYFECANRAVSLCQPSGELWMMAADARAHQDDMEGASHAFRMAAQFAGYEGVARLRECLMLPSVYRDREDISRWRARVIAGLRDIEASVGTLLAGAPKHVLTKALAPNFLLPYQGEVDVDIQRATSAVMLAVIRHLGDHHQAPLAARSPSDRIRIGFCSRFFYRSTVGNYFISWLESIDRTRFQVHVYCLNAGFDDMTARARNAADRFWQDECDYEVAAGVIAADGLDALIYPEIGMDSCAYQLAHLRLARLQACGWGHPETTGIANIDHFFSCAEMEPHNAAAHYSEQLELLPGIGTSYPCPAPSASKKQRADFQLPESGTLVLFPQSLFKIHPDNDEIIVSFLGRAPHVTLVMFAGQSTGVSRKFTDRLLEAFTRHKVDPRGRIKIMPSLSHDDYKRLNELCDFMLDSLHWSGGNTTLDALATGLPVVTCPGRLMRGRQSAAMLKIVGAEALIATDEQHFVEVALALARDSGNRNALRAGILANRDKLFDDKRASNEFAFKLEQLVVQSLHVRPIS